MIAAKPWGSLGVNLAYFSIAALIVSVSLVAVLPIAESVVNYKSIAAGKLIRVTDGQGYTGWSKINRALRLRAPLIGTTVRGASTP